jgi:hypothetical protein
LLSSEFIDKKLLQPARETWACLMIKMAPKRLSPLQSDHQTASNSDARFVIDSRCSLLDQAGGVHSLRWNQKRLRFTMPAGIGRSSQAIAIRLGASSTKAA